MDDETKALIKEMFAEYDTDGDGYITIDEMRRALRRLDPNVSEDDVRAAIKEADLDHDGRVSLIEFVRMSLI